MRRAIALVVLSSLLPLAGCSVANSVTGRATKETPSELFDPCTIPDDALRSVDVDPATAEPDFVGVQFTDWEACSWEAGRYYLTIAATAEVTVEEFRGRYSSADVRPVAIGTREAYTFRSTYESQRGLCDLVYPSSRGTLLFRTDTKATELLREEGLREDPCTVVLRTANALDHYIPD